MARGSEEVDLSKKRRTKRRRRQRIAMTFFVLLVAVVGAVLSLTVFFNITEVVVEGDLNMHTEREILEVADIKYGSNLLRLPAKSIEQDIWNTLTYIENVNVKRVLPGKVVIQVTETKNLLAVQNGDRFIVVSDQLKVLDITDTADESMIIVRGLTPDKEPVKGHTLVTKNEENIEFLKRVMLLLEEKDLLADITEIDVTDKLNYSLIYQDRIFCMIGTANNLEIKIDMLEEVLLNKTAPDAMGTWDLSIAREARFKAGNIHGEDDTPPDTDDIPPDDDDDGLANAPDDDE